MINHQQLLLWFLQLAASVKLSHLLFYWLRSVHSSYCHVMCLYMCCVCADWCTEESPELFSGWEYPHEGANSQGSLVCTQSLIQLSILMHRVFSLYMYMRRHSTVVYMYTVHVQVFVLFTVFYSVATHAWTCLHTIYMYSTIGCINTVVTLSCVFIETRA